MERYTQFLWKHKIQIILLFAAAVAICAVLSKAGSVNYRLADGLADGAASERALKILEEEYNRSIPNMRVMVYDVSIPAALGYKEELESIDGVKEVVWLDDAVNIYEPLEMAEEKIVEEYYKDGNACYTVTVEEAKEEGAVPAIRELIGESGCMSGPAAESVIAAQDTKKDVGRIVLLAFPAVVLVLLLCTKSWFEPILFLITAGAAVVLNRGTDAILGPVSFVTAVAGPMLQTALSMEHSIFLMNRFAENRDAGQERQEAMAWALKQSKGRIFSGGLGAASGFLALTFLSFRLGPDLGWSMVKGIMLSLLCTLCLLPVLAMTGCRAIDRLRHRSFLPGFGGFARFAMGARIPVLALLLLLVSVMFLAQGQNRFSYGGSGADTFGQTRLGRDMRAIEENFGVSNPVVLMVPKGEPEKEKAMNEELLELDAVTSVISYANSVGSAIPDGFVAADTLSGLYSAHYSRFVITLDTQETEAGWEDEVNAIRNIGEKYYGAQVQYTGELVRTQDMKEAMREDCGKGILLAAGFMLCVLLVNFRSLSLPLILLLIMEASVWINLGIPYFTGQWLHYIGYLIVGAIQPGLTAGYGISFASRYMEFRRWLPSKQAAGKTLEGCFRSILGSALLLALAGCILGGISTNGVLSQLGWLVGRGAAISAALALLALPSLLPLLDGLIKKTTLGADFATGKEASAWREV